MLAGKWFEYNPRSVFGPTVTFKVRFVTIFLLGIVFGDMIGFFYIFATGFSKGLGGSIAGKVKFCSKTQ